MNHPLLLKSVVRLTRGSTPWCPTLKSDALTSMPSGWPGSLHRSVQSIPPQVPAAVCQLKILRSLHMNHNALKVLPDQLMMLKMLEELDVSHNHLTQVPNSIRHCYRLRVFRAAHNIINSLG